MMVQDQFIGWVRAQHEDRRLNAEKHQFLDDWKWWRSMLVTTQLPKLVQGCVPKCLKKWSLLYREDTSRSPNYSRLATCNKSFLWSFLNFESCSTRTWITIVIKTWWHAEAN